MKIAFELEIGNFNPWDKIREKSAILWKSKAKKSKGLFEIFFSRKLMISIHYFYIFSLMCCGSELAVLLPES